MLRGTKSHVQLRRRRPGGQAHLRHRQPREAPAKPSLHQADQEHEDRQPCSLDGTVWHSASVDGEEDGDLGP